ncbi:MAG: C4-dicarboxylate ABC transporter [Brevundimonas subvibrioides]|uniref:C4-dicarboxylate ABC transporter n=1 Tax=Brevundimonas subvibrioides TaxID=74313 RepID=A0A258HG57_9CAUL|nr:YdbH domain-containing protein [Brevundimonas subvibrioides]OYX55322.1 MAG: C4-dicarboxylate ABC transporter [Brevundimonas subvibrioides]
MSDTPPERKRQGGLRLGRAIGIGLAIGLIVLSLLAAVIWLNRRAAAREMLVGWLDQRGIQADVEIERLELNGFVGSVRIGDQTNPDVTIQRVEVDYALGLPWSSTGLGVTPSRIRLVRPVARATWKDGELSFGSLDPLIEEFIGKPPRPDSRGPVVIVETGRLRLDTEYGPLSLLADARIDDGKLMRLAARMPAASLKSGAIEARGLGGSLDLTTTGDRVALNVDLGAEGFAAPGLSAEGARLSGTAELPYPDLKARRGGGRATVDLTLSGGRLSIGDAATAGAVLTLIADGQVSGWIETLAFNGTASTRLRAASVSAPGLSARSAEGSATEARVTLQQGADGLSWSVEGPARLSAASGQAGDLVLGGAEAASSRLALSGAAGAVEASGPLSARLSRATFGALVLNQASGRFALDFASGRATALVMTGALASARGAWPLFGPVAADDVPELAEMKRALGAFALDIPALRLTSGDAGLAVTLPRAARLTPANGGALTISPVATPIFVARPGERGGGALNVVATRGQGLPEATFVVPNWRLTAGGFEATLAGRAALDFGLARGLNVQTRGVLATNAGRLTYVASDCLTFTAERLELEENDVMDLSGGLCASGGPLVVSQDGRWRAGGRLTDVAASAPFLAMGFSAIQGTAFATGSKAGLGLEAVIASADVEDATRPRRFNPVTASGSATLAEERWTGVFDLARNDIVLGKLTLAHDGTTGEGGIVIDAPSLTFAGGGLQPADLSPLAADFVQSPATGTAAFSGRLNWSDDLPEGTSSGRLVIPGLDFVSPAGAVKGLSGTIDFTNLAPLTTASDQSLRIATLESVADFTELDLTFSLDKAAISVAGGEIRAAGGTVRVEPFSVPLDRRPFSGVIVLDRVQLGELIAGAGFGDRVKLDAVVSGRLPFTSDPDAGVRITGGTLYAAQPGRLAIAREALSDLEAGGGGDVPPNTVEDLAYQAMENLAFDSLTADLESQDEGRLGVRFHIMGRHDPPQRQELRLSLSELISREFLNRTLPLPSGTGINLTLDTTLNLNQLVSDLLAVNRARNGDPDPESGPEQP